MSTGADTQTSPRIRTLKDSFQTYSGVESAGSRSGYKPYIYSVCVEAAHLGGDKSTMQQMIRTIPAIRDPGTVELHKIGTRKMFGFRNSLTRTVESRSHAPHRSEVSRPRARGWVFRTGSTHPERDRRRRHGKYRTDFRRV